MILGEHKHIDTEKFSAKLREKGIDKANGKLLITRFDNSLQGKDLTLPANCSGFGRIHHFKRNTSGIFPPNSLPIDPALHALKLPDTDTLQVQVFQNAICSWRCWYCFVDFNLLAANPKFSEFKTVSELIDLYQNESLRPPIIDLSGGQPDLIPEWNLWFADEIHKRNLQDKVYLWSDDNLSNDYLWRHLSASEVQRLAEYKNYGRVGCFKGFDSESFSFNTLAAPELFDNQFSLMKKLVDGKFDVYGYCTLTSPSTSNIEQKVKRFVDRLQQEVHEIFPLRTIPLEIFAYTPTRHRMNAEHEKSMETQNIAVAVWKDELEKRFTVSERNQKIFANKF